ncbi:MAG: magnesium transporter [Verrucomicrobia bacterium]|nr:magnesium transporter [Verrucomicrobiota bacterium]
MIGRLLKPELTELIHQRAFSQLRDILSSFPPEDIGEILTDLAPEDRAVLLRLLPQQLAADVFEQLGVEVQERLLHALGNEQVAHILNEMEPDDRTALLEELPAAATQKLLNLLSPEERKIAVTLLGYPEDSIGRRMTPEYVAVKQDWTVAEVLAHLRQVGQQRETLNQLFVVDPQAKLAGVLRLRNVVVAEMDVPVAALLDPSVITLRATDDQETAVEMFRKYDRTVLPVVDSHERLVGVVTVDDVLDVVTEEATEDIQKMGAVEALDAPYLETGLLAMIQKRVGWLILLFLGQMLTASAMAHYEADLASALVLVLFIPLIISSGGNSGAQASTLVIRAMATGDVKLRDWLRVFRRESVLGLALGGVLAVIGFLRIALWPNRATLYTDHYQLVGLVVGLSLVGVVAFGSLVGAMLPFGLRRLKLDPATCSAPFVATLVDVSGLIIYFSIAQIVLSGTLL